MLVRDHSVSVGSLPSESMATLRSALMFRVCEKKRPDAPASIPCGAERRIVWPSHGLHVKISLSRRSSTSLIQPSGETHEVATRGHGPKLLAGSILGQSTKQAAPLTYYSSVLFHCRPPPSSTNLSFWKRGESIVRPTS